MKRTWIPRILALLLMLALIVVCILLAQPVRAVECRLEGKPEPTPWEPDEADVLALARTLYGECRGCSELQQRAVCWCIFNRVDDARFPDTLIGVLSAPYQFAGYRTDFPVEEGLYKLALECMMDWHSGQGRVLEPEYVFFHGNGRINIFTTAYGGGERWAEE